MKNCFRWTLWSTARTVTSPQLVYREVVEYILLDVSLDFHSQRLIVSFTAVTEMVPTVDTVAVKIFCPGDVTVIVIC